MERNNIIEQEIRISTFCTPIGDDGQKTYSYHRCDEFGQNQTVHATLEAVPSDTVASSFSDKSPAIEPSQMRKTDLKKINVGQLSTEDDDEQIESNQPTLSHISMLMVVGPPSPSDTFAELQRVISSACSTDRLDVISEGETDTEFVE